MERDVEKVIDLWKRSYSDPIKKYSPYKVTQQLRQIAALFSPGLTYYYILNYHNLELDYVSDGVKEITGIPQEEFTLEKSLKQVLPEELAPLQQRELVISDFVNNLSNREDMLFYKCLYTYKMKDLNGTLRTMLIQSTPLSISDDGNLEHIISIHTDVTHMKLTSSNKVSFIHQQGGASYYNVDASEERFNPSLADSNNSIISELTKREIEIAGLLAKGVNAEKIAAELHVSFNTVRTHRRNMLQKLGCGNTTELVVKCLAAGVIGY